jgi:GNAT superfamily N-acetyltransferase
VTVVCGRRVVFGVKSYTIEKWRIGDVREGWLCLMLNNLLTATVADMERIEMEAWSDCFAAAPVAFAKEFGLSCKRMDHFGLFAVAKSQKILFNRSLGIGVAQSVDEDILEGAMTWLRDHCGPNWAVPLADGAQPPELTDWLSEKGLTVTKPGIAKFQRAGTLSAEAIECAYDVRCVTAQRATDFGLTVQQGFAMDEGFEKWFAALCGRPNWRTYVAYDASTPAGVGAMFIKDGNAWLGMGATLPAYRGRGIQSAMLAHRISEAATLGAKTLSIDTYHAGVGEPPNSSYRNVVRAGFSLIYFRPEYVTQ